MGFRNVYGPTECSIHSTSSNKSSTIGKPLPNVICYVVHPDEGTLCPPGVSGELWIGGIGVSLGYHNRPELTAEKFIPDPFSSSGKVYKTGDRVKWNEEGELVYLGRFDHQVKLRGYRIELGEVQAELEKQKNVMGALAMVHEDKLVAFVSSGSNNTSEHEEIESLLWTALKSDDCSLTSYMLPWKIVVLDEFPLTPNGKVDRKRLLLAVLSSFSSQSPESLVPPETPTHEYLCGLFVEVLRVDSVGIDCNLIEIGVHSLQIMQLVVRIRGYYNIDTFSVRQCINLGTARHIAEHIDGISQEDASVAGLLPSSLPVSTNVAEYSSKKRGLSSSLIAKAFGVMSLFISTWISILPAY